MGQRAFQVKRIALVKDKGMKDMTLGIWNKTLLFGKACERGSWALLSLCYVQAGLVTLLSPWQ